MIMGLACVRKYICLCVKGGGFEGAVVGAAGAGYSGGCYGDAAGACRDAFDDNVLPEDILTPEGEG